MRPGLQYVHSALGVAAVTTLPWTVLIRAGTAHLRGLAQASALGYQADLDRAKDALAGRWLTCDATPWLRRAHDHSALGWFGKPAHVQAGESVALRGVQDRDGLVEARLVTGMGGVVVAWAPGEEPRVVALDDDEPDDRLRIHYTDGPVDLPDVAADGVCALPELLAMLGRSRPGRSRRAPRRATVDVVAPAEDGDPWGVVSEDLAEILGAGSGPDAEPTVLELLAITAPALVEALRLDSYETTFCAYVTDEQTARAVADALRRLRG